MKLMLTLVFIATGLVGCAGNGNKPYIEMTALECPSDGKQYFFTATSEMLGRGAGVAKIAGVCGGTCLDNKGNQIACDAKVAVAAINPDRIDTIVPTVLTAGGHVGAAAIQADAIRYSARKSTEAAENAAPDVVNLISQGQEQLSVAEAVNLTDVKTSTSTVTETGGMVYKPEW
jgi:hypothetical protein